jgi:hypothetical protein
VRVNWSLIRVLKLQRDMVGTLEINCFRRDEMIWTDMRRHDIDGYGYCKCLHKAGRRTGWLRRWKTRGIEAC